MLLRRVLLSLIGILAAPAFAYDIPKGLSQSDRLEIIRTLGLNAATKLLDNPYPLGGYSGFEIGISMEFIDIENIRQVGCAPGTAGCLNTAYSDDTEWRFSRITIGKGVYKDIDIFFQFIPPVGGVRITDYGGALRWSFYQARFLPINVSAVVDFDQLNYEDSFINLNVGADIIVGVNVENFALYFGGGEVQATGRFIGDSQSNTTPANICGPNCTASPGDPAIDPSTGTVTDHISASHTVVGLSVHYDDLFAAAQVDRYLDAVYSFKVGMRF